MGRISFAVGMGGLFCVFAVSSSAAVSLANVPGPEYHTPPYECTPLSSVLQVAVGEKHSLAFQGWWCPQLPQDAQQHSSMITLRQQQQLTYRQRQSSAAATAGAAIGSPPSDDGFDDDDLAVRDEQIIGRQSSRRRETDNWPSGPVAEGAVGDDGDDSSSSSSAAAAVTAAAADGCSGGWRGYGDESSLQQLQLGQGEEEEAPSRVETLQLLCQRSVAQQLVDPRTVLAILEYADMAGAVLLRSYCLGMAVANMDVVLQEARVSFERLSQHLLLELGECYSHLCLDGSSSSSRSSSSAVAAGQRDQAVAAARNEQQVNQRQLGKRPTACMDADLSVSQPASGLTEGINMLSAAEGALRAMGHTPVTLPPPAPRLSTFRSQGAAADEEAAAEAAAAKLVRTCNKKLQQIEMLEAKFAAGEQLDEQQAAKVSLKGVWKGASRRLEAGWSAEQVAATIAAAQAAAGVAPGGQQLGGSEVEKSAAGTAAAGGGRAGGPEEARAAAGDQGTSSKGQVGTGLFEIAAAAGASTAANDFPGDVVPAKKQSKGSKRQAALSVFLQGGLDAPAAVVPPPATAAVGSKAVADGGGAAAAKAPAWGGVRQAALPADQGASLRDLLGGGSSTTTGGSSSTAAGLGAHVPSTLSGVGAAAAPVVRGAGGGGVRADKQPGGTAPAATAGVKGGSSSSSVGRVVGISGSSPTSNSSSSMISGPRGPAQHGAGTGVISSPSKPPVPTYGFSMSTTAVAHSAAAGGTGAVTPPLGLNSKTKGRTPGVDSPLQGTTTTPVFSGSSIGRAGSSSSTKPSRSSSLTGTSPAAPAAAAVSFTAGAAAGRGFSGGGGGGGRGGGSGEGLFGSSPGAAVGTPGGSGLHVSLFDLMLQKRNSPMPATKASKGGRAEGKDGAVQTTTAAAAVPPLPAWGGVSIPPAAAAASGGSGGDKGGGVGGLGVSPAGPAAVAGTSPAAVAAAAVAPVVAVKSLKEIQAEQEQQKMRSGLAALQRERAVAGLGVGVGVASRSNSRSEGGVGPLASERSGGDVSHSATTGSAAGAAPGGGGGGGSSERAIIVSSNPSTSTSLLAAGGGGTSSLGGNSPLVSGAAAAAAAACGGGGGGSSRITQKLAAAGGLSRAMGLGGGGQGSYVLGSSPVGSWGASGRGLGGGFAGSSSPPAPNKWYISDLPQVRRGW